MASLLKRFTRRSAAHARPGAAASQDFKSTFLEQLPQLLLCHSYAKILRTRLAKPTIRWAIVGEDSQFFHHLEALRDFGIEVSQHFECNPADIFHPHKPLSEMICAEYDAIVVCANQSAVENTLATRVARAKQTQHAETPVFRISALRNGVGEALGSLQAEHCHTSLNPVKLMIVALLAHLTQGQGDIVEAGSYLGGTGIFLGALMRTWHDARTVNCVDTYEGMPPPTEKDGQTIFQAGLFHDNLIDRVQTYVDAHDLRDRVILHKGLIQQRLPTLLSKERGVSFALIDTDQYAGTAAGLATILPHLRPNGAILVDDYTLEGVKLAIDEAKQRHPGLTGFEVSFNFYLLWHNSGRFLR
jgi:predicted O-methyltransferase YrrM